LAPDDRRLREAERKIGELTMENEILRAAARKGAADAAREATEVSAELAVPLAVVCRVLEAPRSTVYARRAQLAPSAGSAKRGPKTRIADDDLVALIRTVIAEWPFAGEGHRKVRARLRRQHEVRVGRHRVLRLMRREGLLAPQRLARRRRPRPHDGSIIPDRPDAMWGVDATMAHTVADGWVWVFVCIDHSSRVAKCDAFAAPWSPAASPVTRRRRDGRPRAHRPLRPHRLVTGWDLIPFPR
jgi:hypothetical protein